MDGELELCGAYWSGDDMLPTCDLPKGHAGDHHTEATWPQWLPRPLDPDREPSAMERVLHAAWGPLLAQQLGVRPITGSTSVTSAEEN